MFLIFSSFRIDAQDHMVRIYEDNDVLNVFGNASDDAYTNGVRLDYYYTKDHRSTFFLDRWMPKAGKDAVNTFGVSAMQLMFTPKYITKTQPDVHDYPYAGALFLTHSLNSSNPEKKYNLQTELLAGVMGPAAMADKLQILMHRIIGDDRPMGWQYQMPNALLVNLSFAGEKMLLHYKNAFEVIGGARAEVGTLFDGASGYGIVRVGRMNPYFQGGIPRYSGKGDKAFQLYGFFKPSADWLKYNAMVDGAAFRGKSDYYKRMDGEETPATANTGIEGNIEFGVVAAWKNIGASFSQKLTSPMLQSFDRHIVGNASIYISW
ncbi:lipid A-modifier LpxR family protein [Chitinophagaceae bacterium MMS25-I14]